MVVMCLVFVVIMIRVVMVAMFLVIFTLQFGAGLLDGAFRRRRQDEEIQRPSQQFDCRIDGSAILGTLGFVFETHNIGAGRMQFHGDPVAFKRNVQLADSMFMGVELPGLLCCSRNSADRKDQRQGSFHVQYLPFHTLTKSLHSSCRPCDGRRLGCD